MKYALKEWSTTIEALGKGQIIAVWRKGGIEDSPSINIPFESFNIEQNQIVLFPTFSHQNIDKVKKDFWVLFDQNSKPNKDNQIKIKSWVEIIETIEIKTLNELLSVSSELINNDEHLKSSWSLYPEHFGKVLLLRVYSLSDPILITNQPEYSGCKSWIELKIDVPKANSKPVLSFKEYNKKARYIKALLENAAQEKDSAILV